MVASKSSMWGTLQGQIVGLSDILLPEEIAERFEIDLGFVLSILEGAGQSASPAVVIDARSGKVSHHRTFRAAYYHICLQGLTEWSWHTKAAYDAWRSVNKAAA